MGNKLFKLGEDIFGLQTVRIVEKNLKHPPNELTLSLLCDLRQSPLPLHSVGSEVVCTETLLVPHFCRERQLIKFRPSLAPRRIEFGQDGYEPLAVRRFDQVDHLMDDHVFDEVLGLLDQFGVQPNTSCLVIAAVS